MHQRLNLCHPCICCHGVVVGLSPILISGTNITDDNLTRAPLIHGSARILFNQLGLKKPIDTGWATWYSIMSCCGWQLTIDTGLWSNVNVSLKKPFKILSTWNWKAIVVTLSHARNLQNISLEWQNKLATWKYLTFQFWTQHHMTTSSGKVITENDHQCNKVIKLMDIGIVENIVSVDKLSFHHYQLVEHQTWVDR